MIYCVRMHAVLTAPEKKRNDAAKTALMVSDLEMYYCSCISTVEYLRN
jgi:hypothetical protein